MIVAVAESRSRVSEHPFVLSSSLFSFLDFSFSPLSFSLLLSEFFQPVLFFDHRLASQNDDRPHRLVQARVLLVYDWKGCLRNLDGDSWLHGGRELGGKEEVVSL